MSSVPRRNCRFLRSGPSDEPAESDGTWGRKQRQKSAPGKVDTHGSANPIGLQSLYLKLQLICNNQT
jgi:hypothetical protein